MILLWTKRKSVQIKHTGFSLVFNITCRNNVDCIVKWLFYEGTSVVRYCTHLLSFFKIYTVS